MALGIMPRDAEANRELLGPFFVGMIMNYLLWGIQISQTYYYYKSFRETDRMWFKAGVALLFILDTFQSVCATEGVWHFMVDGWGNPNPIFTPFSAGFKMITIGDALTASIVHVLYAQKVYALLETPHNYIWTVVVLFLSLCQLAGGIGCMALTFAIDVTLSNFHRIKVWSCIWLITASLTDIIITVLMSWRLSKIRTGFKKTDDIISKLIRSTVETGLAPAIAQILDLIVFLIWPQQSFHVALTLLNPKVYSNSVMALLNSRSPTKPGEVWNQSSQERTVDSISIRPVKNLNMATDLELTPNSYKRDFSPSIKRSF